MVYAILRIPSYMAFALSKTDMRWRCLRIAACAVALASLGCSSANTAPTTQNPVVASDDFERAQLGPNWIQVLGGSNAGIVGGKDFGALSAGFMSVDWIAQQFGADQFSEIVIAASKDPNLIDLVRRGWAAWNQLATGRRSDNPVERSHLVRLARLRFLAPDITAAILEGRQPVELTARSLLRCSELPIGWEGQRRALGFC